jgi:glutathione peroxidase
MPVPSAHPAGAEQPSRELRHRGRLPPRKRTHVSTLSDFTATDITGKEVDLSQYEGKAVLVVNTASKCGFTPQYEGLEALYGKYEDQGLVILGFPCDQFGHQEPGSEDEIQEFCQLNYGVSFPMFAKVDVNGGAAHPLYQWLRSEKGGIVGDKIRWNFTKFLIGRDGNVVDRYASVTKPEKLEGDIEKVLTAD